MAAKRHERTRARRAALQVLYSGEITEVAPVEIVEQGAYLEDGAVLDDYAVRLVGGIGEHAERIDEYLAEASENWTLARMPIVDRSILRLATYEMLYVDEVPLSVSINEAVELAKDFGGEDESHRFVNGVLGRIAKRLGEDLGVGDQPAEGGSAGEPDEGQPVGEPAGEGVPAGDPLPSGDGAPSASHADAEPAAAAEPEAADAPLQAAPAEEAPAGARQAGEAVDNA